MRRREFIALLGGAVAWPCATRAQPAGALPVVGVLNMQTPELESTQITAIRQGLKEAGFIEGQNVAFDFRFAEGRNDRLPALAAALVDRGVNVIVANTTPPAIAAKAATATIPIVFAFGADPVELGLVASFNRPGGNLTGVAFLVNKLVAKRLELLCEVTSSSAAIGMLVDPLNPNAKSDVKNTQAAADALGRKLIIAETAAETDLAAAFAMLVEKGIGALFVGPNANFRIWRARLLALVAQHRLRLQLLERRLRPRRRPDELWPRSGGRVSSRRPLCGPCSEGRKARGAAGRTADHIRFRAQSARRQGARRGGVRDVAGARHHGDRMKRREFITLVVGAAAWPLIARAQQGQHARRIATLTNTEANDAEWVRQLAAFLSELKGAGWEEGRNVLLDHRFTGGDVDRILKGAAAGELPIQAPTRFSSSTSRPRRPWV